MPAFQSFFRDLPKALLWLRLDARRKQREVAESAGVTQAMLCSYEKGARVPTLKSLVRTLDALGVGFEDLGRVLRLVQRETSPGEARVLPPRRRSLPSIKELSSEELAALVGSDQPLDPTQEEYLRRVLEAFRRDP